MGPRKGSWSWGRGGRDRGRWTRWRAIHSGLVNRTKSYIQSSNVVRTMFKDYKRWTGVDEG